MNRLFQRGTGNKIDGSCKVRVAGSLAATRPPNPPVPESAILGPPHGRIQEALTVSMRDAAAATTAAAVLFGGIVLSSSRSTD